MTAGGLTATGRTGVIEGRGRFKRGRRMACTTVRARHHVIGLCRFA